MRGSPSPSPRRSARSTRFGPATEPIVVAQTTRLRSRPRWCGAARSAPANRLWLPAAVPPPKRRLPRRSRGSDGRAAAAMTRRAPAAATTYPRTSPGRRPRAALTRATGMARSAPPSTWAVVPRPARASDPPTSFVSSAMTAMPLAVPTPPRTWLVTSVPRVRRCSTPRSLVTPSLYGRSSSWLHHPLRPRRRHVRQRGHARAGAAREVRATSGSRAPNGRRATASRSTR